MSEAPAEKTEVEETATVETTEVTEATETVETTEAGETAEAPETEENSDLVYPDVPKDKDAVYARLAEYLNKKVEARLASVAARYKTKTGQDLNFRKIFGDDDGRKIVVSAFEGILKVLTAPNEDGTLERRRVVGLPQGLGSIELLVAHATTKKTPQKVVIEVPDRRRVKWNTGKAVDQLLASCPDLPPEVEIEVETPTEEVVEG